MRVSLKQVREISMMCNKEIHEIYHIGQLSIWARELDLKPVSSKRVFKRKSIHHRGRIVELTKKPILPLVGKIDFSDNQMLNNEMRATISNNRINILTVLPSILTLIRKTSDPTEMMLPSKVPFVVIILTRVFVFIILMACLRNFIRLFLPSTYNLSKSIVFMSIKICMGSKNRFLKPKARIYFV
jgi:hypothetical protein